ncbi:O-antigen ligase family protein [Rhodocista pekingensis]|uniref:O-antigen ligase family protein n=1 Tax=Rhodocista pekingensis TaxID=201185 RepID=A0ABW2KXY1_9PROT
MTSTSPFVSPDRNVPPPDGRVLLALLLLLLLTLPLPFGGARPWAADLFVMAAGGLLAGWAILSPGIDRTGGRFWPHGTGPTLAVAAVALWAVLQALPVWPEAVAHPLWAEAETMLGRDIGHRISLAPAATIRSAGMLAACAAIFFVTAQLCRSRRNAQRLLATVVAGCFVYAAYGIVTYELLDNRILWMERWAYRDDVASTFVNRNSFACFAALGLVSALALLVGRLSAAWIAPDNRRLAIVDVTERAGTYGLVLLAVAIVLLSGILMSHSRGGLAAAAAGSVAAIALCARARRRTGLLRVLLLLGGLVGLTVMVQIGGEGTIFRIVNEGPVQAREILNTVMLRAIASSPLVGYGLGTFEQTFSLFLDREAALALSGNGSLPSIDRGHNDYLEGMLGLGIPAALVLWGSIGAVAARCFQGSAGRRRDWVYPGAAAAATTVVAVHSLVDFSLQIPAVAATYAALLGMGYAQARSSRDPS